MKRRIGIIQHAALGMELPSEPILGMPLVEIFGNCRVLIENHSGVTGYSNCEISVCTRFGTYFISGNKLEIVNMTKYRLVITGVIESVAIKKGM